MEWWHPIPLPRRFASARRSRLVGRRDELEEFEHIWSRVEDGEGQVVLLGGEPGAGKTRLAVEVAGALHDHGATVLAAAATRDGAVPYQPFVEMLDHLFTHAGCCRGEERQGDGDCPLLAGTPYDLGRLSVRAAEHLRPTTGEISGDTRLDLFDSVTLLLRRLSKQRPLAVILDDLHWATPPTAALLKHVAHASADSPILLVATFRTTAPDRSPELSAHLADLHRLDGVHRLDLAGLDTDAIADFVSEQSGISRSQARSPAAVLRDRTGGNPFFLRELWSDMQRHGGLAALQDRHNIPGSIADTITGRLADLGPDVRETLEMTAILGESFDITTLVGAGTIDRARSVEAVDAAVAVGLIEPLDEPPTRYGFVHALARQVLLDRLPTRRLQALHARAATTLDQDQAHRPELYPSLALHYLHAHLLGYEERAYHYVSLAAQQAAHSLAYEDAARWFERAATLPGRATNQVAESLLLAAINRVRSGDFARARAIYERLTDMPDPLIRLQAAMGFEDTNWRPGLIDTRAAALLSAAIGDCGLSDDDPRRIRAAASLGRAFAFAGRHDRAEELGDRAIELARAGGDPGTIAHTLRTSLWHGLAPQDVARQLARAAELSAIAAESDDQESLAEAAHFGAMASYLAGRPADLDRYVRQVQAAAVSGRQPFMDYTAICLMQGRAYRRGEFAAAERLARTALQIGEFDAESTDGPYSVQLFMIRRETGGLDSVRELVTGREPFAGHWVPGLLAVYTELGLTDAMRRTLRAMLDRDLDLMTPDARFPIEIAFMADAAADLGDVAAMDALSRPLARYSGGNIVTGEFIASFGSADRYLARFAEAAGDRARADRLFDSALAMDQRMGSTVHVGETLGRHAVALQRRGDDPATARRLAERAREVATPIGQLRVLRWLEASGATVGPEHLTDRELEVLRLLAEGLSNRDIGARLFISANTAANHVRSILTKTGSGNRTQAARYASDHDLV